MIFMASNPTVQVRIDANLRERIEKRAIEKGFVHPSGKVNLPGYLKHLATEDLFSNRLDGEPETEYKV